MNKKVCIDKEEKEKKKNKKKTMQKIGPLKSWFELKIFCTKIHTSASAITGLSL